MCGSPAVVYLNPNYNISLTALTTANTNYSLQMWYAHKGKTNKQKTH